MIISLDKERITRVMFYLNFAKTDIVTYFELSIEHPNVSSDELDDLIIEIGNEAAAIYKLKTSVHSDVLTNEIQNHICDYLLHIVKSIEVVTNSNTFDLNIETVDE